MSNSLLAAAAIVLAGVFYQVPENASRLDETQLRSVLIGPVLSWRLLGFPENRIGERQYAPDGTFWWKRLDADYAGHGRWRIDGGAFCEKYDPAGTWKGRDWVCHPVLTDGTRYFFVNTFVWNEETTGGQ